MDTKAELHVFTKNVDPNIMKTFQSLDKGMDNFSLYSVSPQQNITD